MVIVSRYVYNAMWENVMRENATGSNMAAIWRNMVLSFILWLSDAIDCKQFWQCDISFGTFKMIFMHYCSSNKSRIYWTLKFSAWLNVVQPCAWCVLRLDKIGLFAKRLIYCAFAERRCQQESTLVNWAILLGKKTSNASSEIMDAFGTLSWKMAMDLWSDLLSVCVMKCKRIKTL